MVAAVSDPQRSARDPIRRLLIGAMVLGFLALIVAGVTSAWVMSANQQHIEAVSHTYQVEELVSQLRYTVERAETARRGYIVDSSPKFADTYRRVSAQVPALLDRIERFTADNPQQTRRIATLRQMIAHVEDLSAQSNALVANRQLGTAARMFHDDDSVETLQRIRDMTQQMAREEHGLLAERDARQRASVQTFYAVLAGAGILLIVVAFISVLTVLRYTRALGAATEELRALNESLEDAVEERTADLVRANEEIQRFAYIVSHDLRSPLVNVMGFTAELDAATHTVRELIERADEAAPEIVTEDARLAATEDLPEAIGFIRSSTQKMDALINAILKLSREGRRVLAPERIDMDALVGNIGDTLAHRLDERDAELVIHHPLPPIVSDRLAIDQILSNLIDNAVKYLQPGRPGCIQVRGRTVGHRAIFEVEDNGRGIDTRDHQRVFDLFRRSGAQDQPGEGIGLAHVRALVYRLGGMIDVSSELGKGATFRISLPQTFMPAQEDRK
ncbi:MAG: sensor histidine kinase [Sphingomonas sp.]